MRFFAYLALPLLGLLAVPSPAAAYENQVTVGLETGWAGIPNSSTLPLNGINLGLTAGYGINDAWEIRALGSFNLLFDDDRLRTGMIGAEVTYLLDIVRFVPVFGFGADALVSRFRGDTRGDFAMHALLGVDFLINPRWLVGLTGRGFWVATNNRSFLDALFFTAGFRVGVRFDIR